VVKEEHEEMIRQYEATLAKLREDHNKRVAQLSEQHELEIQNTKERNFALVKKLEELETSDLVKAVGKGARIPAEISQEERDKLEKGLREQEVRIAPQYLYFCTSKLVQKCKY
jgi:exonuclease VII large subunit